MKTRLVDRQEMAERTLGFFLELDGERLDFKPGQACDVTIPNPRYRDEAGTRRTFSIASSPADRRLLFATRLTGSAFKRSLLEAPLGTELELEAPYGAFTLHQNAAKPAVFLAGGIGITPFRSIIKDATAKKLSHRLTLVYSNRDAAGTAFLGDFERWAGENPNFRFIATLTHPKPSEPWAHETGRVEASFLKKHLAHADTAICYIAGPGGFVSGMQQELPKAGADPDNIRAEEFSGY